MTVIVTEDVVVQPVVLREIEPVSGKVEYPQISSPDFSSNVPASPQSHQPSFAKFGQRPLAPSGSAAYSHVMAAGALLLTLVEKGGMVAVGAEESEKVLVRVMSAGIDGGPWPVWKSLSELCSCGCRREGDLRWYQGRDLGSGRSRSCRLWSRGSRGQGRQSYRRS